MRVRAFTSMFFPMMATLVLGCETPQSTDPSLASDRTVLAARASSEFPAPGSANAVPASETRIDVGWVDNSNNETGFEIYRSITGAGGTFVLLTTTAPRVTQYADDNLASPIEYCYKIRAARVVEKTTAYSAFSNSACTTAPPNAPSNPVAVAAPDTRINLSWKDNSNTETSFHVVRAIGEAGTFYYLESTEANVVALSDTTGTPGTLYCYLVRAVRRTTYPDGSASFLYSVNSTTVCATAPPKLPPPLPAAASDARATPTSSATVTVQWSDNSKYEQGFHIYRSTDSGVTWALRATTVVAPLGDSVGLQPDQEVCYRAVAFNLSGEAPPSNNACTTPPMAPTNLTVSRIGSDGVQINWTDNSAVEDGYQVWLHWFHTNCDDAWDEGDTVFPDLPAGSTSYSYTQPYMGCDERYEYYVVAIKDGGRSSPSEVVARP